MAKNWIPPISPLIGSTLSNYYKSMRSGRIESNFYFKVLLTGFISAVSNLFAIWDKIKDRKRQATQAHPIFIIGHWRSGTTHLHNLLCQDPNAGYITTYQSVFPNNLFSKGLFKTFMKMLIPGKRPSDNVKLNVDFPQEDEFALENLIAPSFYNFFFFPDKYDQLFDETILFKNRKESEIELWKRHYKELIAKGQSNTNGKYMILKNPVNTGRVERILEMYPNARFIHIYRNPIIVYLSTKKFFLTLIPELQLQNSTEEQIIDLTFDLYSRLMRNYLENKASIPPSQLIEIDFESFEKDPIHQLKEIYTSFSIPNWDQNLPYFEEYLNHLGDYKKNTYKITRVELDRIKTDWGFAFSAFGYSVPNNLEVID